MIFKRVLAGIPQQRISLVYLFQTQSRRCFCRQAALQKKPANQTKLLQPSVRYASGKKPSLSDRGPISWVSLGVFLLAGGGLVFYVRKLKEQKEKEKEKHRRQSIGKASIGGPIEMVDTDGNEITEKDFLGKWLLIYFGFCHCPDICPDQLEKMSTVIDKIDAVKNVANLQPLYISVDPHRDTPKVIKDYLKDFHPRFIGLTGSEEQVKKTCKTYRVYYSAGPKDEDEDYIVDHTIIMYLVDPNGEFVEYYGQNKSIDDICSSITLEMMKKH